MSCRLAAHRERVIERECIIIERAKRAAKKNRTTEESRNEKNKYTVQGAYCAQCSASAEHGRYFFGFGAATRRLNIDRCLFE